MQAEMTRLIENLGGVASVAPSVREVPLEEQRDVVRFWGKARQSQIDVLILMTGVGTRTLIQALSKHAPMDQILAAFQKMTLVVRGPKPVKALTEVNLTPN